MGKLTKKQVSEDQEKRDAAAMAAFGGAEDHPYRIGQNYLFCYVTRYYTGKLLRVLEKELVIVDAAWIADTGRWANFVATGDATDIEPYPDGMEVIIPREGMASNPISWPLPRNVVGK